MPSTSTPHAMTVALVLIFLALLSFAALVALVYKTPAILRTIRRTPTFVTTDAEAQIPKPAIKPSTLHALAASIRRIALRKPAVVLPDPEAQKQAVPSPSASAEKPEPETLSIPSITVTPPLDDVPIPAQDLAAQLALLSDGPCTVAADETESDAPALSPSSSLLSEDWMRSGALLSARAFASTSSDLCSVASEEDEEWLTTGALLSRARALLAACDPYDPDSLAADCADAPEEYVPFVVPFSVVEEPPAHAASASPLSAPVSQWPQHEYLSAISPASSTSSFTSSTSYCDLPHIEDPVWAFPAPPATPPLGAPVWRTDAATDFDLAPPARLVDPASAPPASPPRTRALSSPLSTPPLPSPSSPRPMSFAPSPLWGSFTPRRRSLTVVEEEDEGKEIPAFWAMKEVPPASHTTAPGALKMKPALGLGLACGLSTAGLPTPPPSPVEPATTLCAQTCT